MHANKIFILLTCLMLGAILSASAGESWVDMSGSFDGWRQVGNANWRFENGEFVADDGIGHLLTEEHFSDFQVKAEFWASEGANSGVYLRISNPELIADSSAYEVNIFDNRPDQSYRTGGLVNFAAPSEIINTPGHWNSYDITVQGDHIRVVLNGVTTIDIHDSTYLSGPVSLQYVAGTVKFRKVKIRKL